MPAYPEPVWSCVGSRAQLIELHGPARRGCVDLPLSRQSLEDAQHDGRRVDPEVSSQGGACVGHAETVGAQRGPVRRYERRDLVRDCPHPVRNRDHRSALSVQPGSDIRDALWFIGVQVVPGVDDERLATQLRPRCHRPHVGANAPVGPQHALCLQCPLHGDTRCQDLRPWSVIRLRW